VETGVIAELEELERELSPDLVGLGRYLGLGAKRSVELARSLDVRTADEFREAVAAGRLRDVPGIGPKTEALLVEALVREGEPRPRQGLLLNRARELVGGIADVLGGEAAGEPRRWRDSCEQLAVVCAAGDPANAVARSAAYVEALEPLPDAADEPAIYAALGTPWCPPELREAPFRGEPPDLVELAQIRGDLHSHTTWSDGRASVEEMARAAQELGYDYLAICDHTPAVSAVRGLSPDDVRRQGEEIAAANERLAPFRVLRGIECDILRDGSLDLPDDMLAELEWVQASVHGGQRMPRREMTKRVEEALRNPCVSCLSHPKGRYINRRPENELDLDRVGEPAHVLNTRPLDGLLTPSAR
jgi:DNA polymerase (family 10)